MGYGGEGGELERSGELPPVPRAVMGGALEPVLTATKPRNGYFLRAESFFNVAHFVDGGTRFAPDLSLYGDVPLHQQSHGQSFLALAANRFGGEGFYVLDETGLARCMYDDLDAVRFTRGFLEAPDRYIRAALEDPGEARDEGPIGDA